MHRITPNFRECSPGSAGPTGANQGKWGKNSARIGSWYPDERRLSVQIRGPLLMPVTTTAWVFSLVFGLAMGLIIGIRPQDRFTIRTVLKIVIAFGGIIWLTDPQPMSNPAVAAVAMSLGGIAALAGVALVTKRKPS